MLRIFTFLTVVFLGASAFAATLTEQQKIDSLLGAFDTPGVVFVRNGVAHDGAWAKKHLADKLKEAKPPITTADDFISKVATSSSHSGKPYMIRLKGGKTVECAKWLQDKLDALNKPDTAPAAQ